MPLNPPDELEEDDEDEELELDEDELDELEDLEDAELAEPPLMKLLDTVRNFSLKRPEYPGSRSKKESEIVWGLTGSTAGPILVVPTPATRLRSARSKRGE